jgi:hypothetical protein
MWHVETFDSRGAPGEMDALLEQRLLPWFRSRGFTVHAFVTQASLGERQYWLATEMASFADIDTWPERGGTEGAAIIFDLLQLAVGIRACVISEIGENPSSPTLLPTERGERSVAGNSPVSSGPSPGSDGRGGGGEGECRQPRRPRQPTPPQSDRSGPGTF